MSILEQITERFPVRRSKAQKEAFRKWIMGKMTEMGYRPKVEENGGGSHQNVVCGNPETAKVVFTAHYDTSTFIGLPNMMIPRNWLLYILYQMVIVGLLLAIAFGGGFLLALATGKPDLMRFGLLGIYLLEMVIMLHGPANKHNVNDNTSGVAAVLETMAQTPPEKRGDVAFILFDNEEKGCRGSKAFAKDHLQVQYTRLIVNLDCVGVGEHFLLTSSKLARSTEEYVLLERVMAAQEGRSVHFFSSATSAGNSDHRSFKCSVGVASYNLVSGVGFCTGAIHTPRDTEADQGNIDFLVKGLTAFVAQLPGENDAASGTEKTPEVPA